MRSPTLRRTLRSLIAPLFVTLMFGCDSGGGGGGGCDLGCGTGGDGEGGVAYEFPSDGLRMDQAAQVHVTESGLSFIEDNIEPILGQFLGDGGLTFCLPETDLSGIANICGSTTCADGSRGCDITAEITYVNIIPMTVADGPDMLRAEVGLFLRETILAELLLNTCELNLDTGDEGLPVAANITFVVGGPPGERVSIEFGSEDLEFEISSDLVDVDGEEWYDVVPCEIVDAAVPLFIGLIEDQVTGPIDDLLGTALCSTCEVTEDCPVGSSCNGDGVCIYDGGDECVPLELGLETEFDVGSLLADISPGLEAKLGISAFLANYADMMGPNSPPSPYVGIDLAAQLGLDTEPNVCVPYRPAPDISRYPKSPGINAETTPGGEQFAIGIGLARRALDFALWEVYNSGLLCLSVGTDLVEQLSTSTIAALVPSLGALTERQNRPLTIALRPNQPPRVELGSGEYNAETGELVDPLLTIYLEDLDLEFYTFVEERDVRVFTLNGDVVLPLGLDVNENNEIIVIGLNTLDVNALLPRLEARDGELLNEDEVANVATLLPGLINSLLPTLLGDGDLIPPIAIPEIQGFRIIVPPGGITSVDDNEMLAIFADIGLAETVEEKTIDVLPAIARANVRLAPQADIEALLADIRRNGARIDPEVLHPEVTLDMEMLMDNAMVGDVEYSYRVNGGLWSFWHEGDTVEVVNSMLMLQGRHTVDVRARLVGDEIGRNVEYATTEVVVDYQEPDLELVRDGAEIIVDTWDIVSEPEQLRMQYQVNGRGWVRPDSLQERIDLSNFVGETITLEVEVYDEANHRAYERKSFNLSNATPVQRDNGPSSDPGFDEPVTDGVDSPGEAGCSATGTGAPFGLGVLFLAMMALRRRRTRFAAGAMAALLLVGCGGDNKSNGNTDRDECDPECAEGQTCFEGACLDCLGDDDCPGDAVCEENVCVSGCASDDECGDGFVCNEGGECVVDNSCDSDSDCPDGQICTDGECEAVDCIEDSDCSCDAPDIAACIDNMCMCETPCADGCGDSQACCFSTNTCVEVSGACAEQECPPGTILEAISDPVYDSNTCTETTECDCVELPPLPLGDVGRHLGVGVNADGSAVMISAYNATYGDLMLGTVAADDTISWEFVDGLPEDGAITGSIDGPRGGVAADGFDAGFFSDVIIAADGSVHIAYWADELETPTLRYAFRADGGEWSFFDLDAGDTVANYVKMVADGDGLPVIVYTALAEPTDDGNFLSEVRMIRGTTAAPASAEDFGAPVAIDSIVHPIPCGDTCSSRTSCRLDLNVCSPTERSSRCDDSCAEGEECFENEDGSYVCSAFRDRDGAPTHALANGVYLDAHVFSDGSLGVAHWESVNGILRYVPVNLSNDTAGAAVFIDGGYIDETEGLVDAGAIGLYPDLHETGDGTRLVTYYDADRTELLAYDFSSDSISVVDDGFRCFDFEDENCIDVTLSFVGADSAVYEDGGTLNVAYQDATLHEVLEAPRGEFGWQIPGVIAGDAVPYDGSYGFYNEAAVDANGAFVVTHRINNRAEVPTRDVVIIR